jgi:hypothetical protein
MSIKQEKRWWCIQLGNYSHNRERERERESSEERKKEKKRKKPSSSICSAVCFRDMVLNEISAGGGGVD